MLPNWLGPEENRYYDAVVVEDMLEMCAYVAGTLIEKSDDDGLKYVLKTLK